MKPEDTRMEIAKEEEHEKSSSFVILNVCAIVDTSEAHGFLGFETWGSTS